MTHSTHRRFAEALARRYPILAEQGAVPDAETLVFPQVVDVPARAVAQAGELVRALYGLRELPLYRRRIGVADAEVAAFAPGNRSVLMGYDFHLDAEGRPWLIEVNTNAAFSLGADLLNDCQSLADPFVPSFIGALKQSFVEEYRLARPGEALRTVAIVDENYRAQNYYFEFLMFSQLFERWGWRCVIGAPEDFRYAEATRTLEHRSGLAIDLVYNRLCDFLLEEPGSRELRRAYLAGRTCFSPNPNEYWLLADKQRLVEWSTPGWLEAAGAPAAAVEMVRQTVPATLDVEGADAERLWRDRRQLFFKPKHAFGGKGAFRGANVTRRVFADIIRQPYIAQAFVPPASVRLASGEEYKFDLRFYVYRDALQLMVARVYQGQVTNLRTPGGGFAAVRVAGDQG